VIVIVPSVLVDTGPLVALLHRRDNWHTRVTRFLSGYRGELLTTWAVITEAVYVCDDPRKSRDLMEMIESSTLKLPAQGAAEAARIKWYFGKYADRDPDLADLSLLALAEVTRVTDVITVDIADFAVYRLKNGKQLQNLLAN
jgi:uncharacterized protein